MSTSIKTDSPRRSRDAAAADLAGHAVYQLSELSFARESMQEFQLGEPRRSVPLLGSSREGRLNVIQRDLGLATVYYVDDQQYTAAYRAHHKGRDPGPDNLSFTLVDQGIIIVRVHKNDLGSHNLSFKKGTATITEWHKAALDEAVKQGLSVLRGLSEGATQHLLEERRERLREGRLRSGYEEQLPTVQTVPMQDLCVTVRIPGPSLKTVEHTLSATLVSAGHQRVYVAKSRDFEKLATTRSSDPITEQQVPDGSRVVVIDENRIIEALGELRSLFLKSPSSEKIQLLRELERLALTSLSGDERAKLGESAFKMLSATLERNRAENLSPHKLAQAFYDVYRASPLEHGEALATLRAAMDWFGIVDEAFIRGAETALQVLGEGLQQGTFDTTARAPKERRSELGQKASARSFLLDPLERLSEAKRNGLDIAKPCATPSQVIADQVARIGLVASDSAILEQDLRHNAPYGIEIPAACSAETGLRRDVLDDRGQYLHTRFSHFEVKVVVRNGPAISGFAEVRWHTRTQSTKPELPSFRVTLDDGATTYELTSLAVHRDWRDAAEGQYFVSNANSERNLFRIKNGLPQVLGAIQDFGLVETTEGRIYSRSCKRITDNEAHSVPADRFGREQVSPHVHNLRDSWHLPYIPAVMDIS